MVNSVHLQLQLARARLIVPDHGIILYRLHVNGTPETEKRRERERERGRERERERETEREKETERERERVREREREDRRNEGLLTEGDTRLSGLWINESTD
jgi:hypothetical protein